MKGGDARGATSWAAGDGEGQQLEDELSRVQLMLVSATAKLKQLQEQVRLPTCCRTHGRTPQQKSLRKRCSVWQVVLSTLRLQVGQLEAHAVAAETNAAAAEDVAATAMKAAEDAVRDEMEAAAVTKETKKALQKALADIQDLGISFTKSSDTERAKDQDKARFWPLSVKWEELHDGSLMCAGCRGRARRVRRTQHRPRTGPRLPAAGRRRRTAQSPRKLRPRRRPHPRLIHPKSRLPPQAAGRPMWTFPADIPHFSVQEWRLLGLWGG